MLEAGKIYTEVARKIAAKNHPEVSERELEKVLQSKDLDRIEKLADAKGSITSAVIAIDDALGWQGIFLPINLLDTVLYSFEPAELLSGTLTMIRRRDLNAVDKAEIAYTALFAVHGNWVNDNRKRFEGRVTVQYKFLPAELIGLDELMQFYIYIEDILKILEIAPDREDIRRIYERKRGQFKDTYGIMNRDILANHIRYLRQGPTCGPRKRDDDFVTIKIADQVIKHNGRPEEWTVSDRVTR